MSRFASRNQRLAYKSVKYYSEIIHAHLDMKGGEAMISKHRPKVLIEIPGLLIAA
ncbi:MAG: hypothetical protein RNU03_13300 [Candidatus Sedimenticola sp. (ex Thyasira tokunagai)]